MRIDSHTLRNGLRLAATRVEGTSFIDIILAVRVGSRYEPIKYAGISHFLEHMIFRGSGLHPSSFELNQAFERLADGLEAGTTREYTLYSLQVLPEHLDAVLVVLTDLFRNPLLTGIDTEREIVFEEMLEELDEHGKDSDLGNISRTLYFGDHGLARPILGRKPTLSKITPKILEGYFRAHYDPRNMILSAAGCLKPAKFFRQVDRAFGSWKPGGPAPKLKPKQLATPKLNPGPHVKFQSRSASQIEALLTFVGPGECADDYTLMMVLERCLDDGLSSRLQRSLCELKGLLYDIGVSIDSYTDLSLMDFSFKIKEEKTLAALGEILKELKRLKSEPLNASELDKIKKRMHREALGLFESPRHLAVRVAETLLLKLKTPLTFNEWRDRIQSFSASDVQLCAQRLYRPERMTALFQGEVPKADQKAITRLLQSF